MLLAGSLAVASSSAAAQSTSTYAYDAHGRLTSVSRSTGTSTTYAYDAADNRTQTTTAVAGSTPAPFNLGDPVSAASGAWASSNIITVNGVSTAVPVTITGGQYRIGIGPWQTTAGTVTAGQTVQARVQAPAAGGTSRTATLAIGGVAGAFKVTAISDTSPDAYVLGGPASAASNAWAESNTVTIAGINAPAPVTIASGQYRIGIGPWQTTAGTVTSGQTVQVRAQAPAAGGASRTATLAIGGVAGTFKVTAISDTAPDAFNLGGPASATPNAWADSSTVTITGINAAAPISIANGQYRIGVGPWQTTAGTVTSGQTVQVRAQAPAAAGTSRTATLTIGGVARTFQVTATAVTPPDTTPDPFDLGPRVYGPAGTWTASPTVTIAGINAAATVTIVDGQYRINGGSWQTNPGSITAGQTIQVRLFAQPGLWSATLTVGGISDVFEVEALDPGPGPCIPPPGREDCIVS